MSIYSNSKPTFLYIKRHQKTGLMYFGKTIQNPYVYKGSGKRWSNHYKMHGPEFIETVWVSEPYYDNDQLIEDALFISNFFEVDTDCRWANLILENGINGGGDFTHCKTEKVYQKRRESLLKRYGVDSPNKSSEIFAKVKNTNLKNYGAEFTMQNPEVRSKYERTYIKKYGKLGSCLSTPEAIDKRNNTNFQRYGNKCAANSDPASHQKSKETQKKLRDREIVRELRLLASNLNVKLGRNWSLKPDSWIIEKISLLRTS